MNQNTRTELWTILSNAFRAIELTLHNRVPGLTTRSGYHGRDGYLFRAYGQYKTQRGVIIISFSIKLIGEQLHIAGDLAHDQGYVLKDLMRVALEDQSDVEQRVKEIAMQFAALCKTEVLTIEDALKMPPNP